MKKAILVMTAVASLFCSSAKAIQVYFDKDEYFSILSAIAEVAIINFEGEAVGPIAGDSWLTEGVLFDQADTGGNMAIGDGGGFNHNIYALEGRDANIDITFPEPIIAFGLGVFSNNQQSPSERIVFYGLNNTILADIEMPWTSPHETVFVGIITDGWVLEKVAFIEDNGDEDYVGIGDVAIAVPEPTTLILFGLGGLVLRRRRA